MAWEWTPNSDGSWGGTASYTEGEDDVAKMLGGKGWEMRDKHKGITSYDHGSPRGEGWTTGIGSAKGMGSLQDGGWISPGNTVMGPGYELQTVQNPEGDVYWGEQEFRDKYYDPYMQEAVINPIQSLGGPAYGSGTIQGGSEFQEISYRDPSLEEDVTGFIAAPEGTTPQDDITNLTDALGRAQGDYDEMVEALTWEEGHDVYDLAKETLDDAELNARLERERVTGDKPQQYETARALQARSGMAYSGPAKGIEGDITEAGEGSLEGASRAVATAKGDFDLEQEATERALDDATGVWEDAQREYYDELKAMATTASTEAIGTVEGLITGLEGAHGAMGQHPKDLAGIASVDMTGAMSGRGMWTEGINTPGIKEMREWMVNPSGPKAFAQQMQQVMQASYASVGSEEGGE